MKRLDPDQVCAAVIHYGDNPARTLRTVERLRELEPSPGQILVVDNGPSFLEGTWPTVSTTNLTNSGFAGGVNQAAVYAQANGFAAVWVLNNDVTIATHALGALASVISEAPDVEIVGSIVTMEEGERIWFGGGDFDSRTGRAGHREHGVPVLGRPFTRRAIATDWVNGCSMLIPTQAFVERGLFDEDLFLYKEELDWQTRSTPVRAMIVDEPLIDHEVGGTTGSTNGVLGRNFMCRNGLILALRRRGMERARWVFAWALDYAARPLAKGRFRELNAVLFALRTRRMTGFSAWKAMQ